MRWLVCVLSLVLAASAGRTVHAEDEEVQSAVQDYRQVLKRQQELVQDTFERKIKEVQREGNLSQVEALKSEQRRFQRSGEVPDSKELKATSEKYRKALDSARTKVSKTIDNRVKKLTKEGKIEEAQALRDNLKNLDALLAEPDAGQPAAAAPMEDPTAA